MKKDKPQMLTRLINTLRKRGAQGRSFPVQASEATQAAELIAQVVAQRDALPEALRRELNELPRFSFLLDSKGNVVRRQDRTGRWIEWQAAHELFDAEMIDALLAKMQARAAIEKATGSAT